MTSSRFLGLRAPSSTLAPTLIEADRHLFPSIMSHLSAVNHFWQLPNSCYHQSLPSITICHQSSTLTCPITTAVTIKDYNQSSHHPQHTCPPAIMQQMLWWVMLLSAQSHWHWLMLLMSASFCWTQQFADTAYSPKRWLMLHQQFYTCWTRAGLATTQWSYATVSKYFMLTERRAWVIFY